ncbi:hypothetical protein [Vampirovibrio chlorellavorus]|uniref:hypothetical protein n=1 Tax=Vampirovibrio chlorellavorus TaxID=758823 RepID=UPI0026EAD4B4|nr:hypothetical protein [Vampirovibrio chlorellavorus]
MGQDAFAPANGAPAAGNPQGTVFQHPSGGYADNNNNLSGGNFWSSWKGISTIAAGIGAAVYTGIAIYKGKLNIFSGSGNEYGTKALHELTGDLKTAADGLVNKLKTAKKAFDDNLNKENVDSRVTEFKKTFNELKDKNLQSEVTEENYKLFTNLENAHSAYVDKIAEGVKADKAVADVLKSKEVTDLEEAIKTAEGAYNTKLTPPKSAESEAAGDAGKGKPAEATGDAGKDKPAEATGDAGKGKPAEAAGDAGKGKPAEAAGDAGKDKPAEATGDAGKDKPAEATGDAGKDKPATAT